MTTSNQSQPVSFVQAARREIELTRMEGRYSTAANYVTALRSLTRFTTNAEITFDEFTPRLIESYQRWLKVRGVGLGTISCYMRSLRALYNKVYPSHTSAPALANPFVNVYTGIPRTTKRAVSDEDIRRLLHVRLSPGSLLQFARDIFLFSFYCLGMPFVDVAFLRWTQIHDGYISYYRHKTHQPVHVPLEPEMLEIIARYHIEGSSMVFPILAATEGREAFVEYRRKLSQYNHALRRLAAKAGVMPGLTSYVVRHTWASLAYRQHVDLSVIAKALGHENPQTTLIYVRGLEDSQLAKANRLLLSRVTGCTDCAEMPRVDR